MSIPQFEPVYGDEEINAVVAYMKSGGWLTEFRETRALEEEIAAYTGSQKCWMIANGTVSLTCALYALGITTPEQEVICPNFTMVATPNSVSLAGATPVLVDVDPETLCITPETIEPHLTPNTKAVMHVSLNGRSGDMEALVKFCEERDLVLIEDAAQALGSTHKGQHLGTFGLTGSFSFSMPKIITTGQGGALISDDEAFMAKVQRVRDFGRSRGGADEYETIGFNFKYSDLQAVIGREQMKRMEERVTRKKEMFRRYEDALTNIPGVEIIPTDLSETTPWFIDVLVEDREALIEHLKEAGVGSRPFYPALHTQGPFLDRDLSDELFPVSLDVARRGLWLPSSFKVTDEQIEMIGDTIRKFYA
jgi:perosamine synthetase